MCHVHSLRTFCTLIGATAMNPESKIHPQKCCASENRASFMGGGTSTHVGSVQYCLHKLKPLKHLSGSHVVILLCCKSIANSTSTPNNCIALHIHHDSTEVQFVYQFMLHTLMGMLINQPFSHGCVLFQSILIELIKRTHEGMADL